MPLLNTVDPREAHFRTNPRPSALQRRARQLLKREIDFVPHPEFTGGAIGAQAGQHAALPGPATAPRGLPGHLARMCETELLTAEAEQQLFCRMNYLKFRANALRCVLSPEWPDAEAVVAIERHLAEAATIREHLIRANLRLAISIVKKFVTPQHTFDELLSDGTCALMQAVDKFDFNRGFRFSTYAYRAITCNLYRTITNRRKETARLVAEPAEDVWEVPDHRGRDSADMQAGETLRKLLGKLLHRLDRREQFIIRGRYALGAHRKVKTFQRLADRLGVSKERVRQLEQRAIGKLRRFAGELSIEDLGQ